MGPGSLPSDSSMIGLTPTDTRELLEQNVDIITRLVRGEVVNAETRTHKLIDAQLQFAPFTPGGFEMTVAGVASPTGARLAGRYGIGLMSIGATLSPEGFDALAHHWSVVEERAAEYGQTTDRASWRLVGPFHLAETEEQAHKDVEHGIEHWFEYFQHVAAFPQMAVGDGSNVKEMIEFIKNAGIGVIGTPDQAREQIQRLIDQSNGGFGSILNMHTDWANPEATRRSYELMAQEVMPHFQGQVEPLLRAEERARSRREELSQQQVAAVEHMTKKYERELAAKK
jgi:limonene 1,2-monooxygenase